jgi:PEGA domain
MYRVFFVLGGGLLLAACSSTPEWLSLDALKPAPITDSIQFESEPTGATATLSTGQNCKTPCSVSVPADAPFSVTFSLPGYQPDTEQVESVLADGATRLRPNPVVAELTPAPPPAKPAPAKKKTIKKKPTAAKPATKPTSTAAAPAPTTASAPAAATSPWPTAPQTQQQ